MQSEKDDKDLSFAWSAAKADKKAAQVKIQQQEHKRQVCVCVWESMSEV